MTSAPRVDTSAWRLGSAALATGEDVKVMRLHNAAIGKMRLDRIEDSMALMGGTQFTLVVFRLQRSRGGFVAEASLDAKAYHCDALASESGAVLRFPARAFRAALDQDSTFRRAWIAHLAREVRKLRAQCERLSLNSAAERIIHYIEAEGVDGSVTLNQSRKAWAEELGLTHEAVYRTLRRLQAEGKSSVTQGVAKTGAGFA